MIDISTDHPLIPVRSAFGGLAIYSYQALQTGMYCGLNEEGSEMCEHVSLNLALNEQGHGMYINPELVAGGTREFFGKDLLRSLRR